MDVLPGAREIRIGTRKRGLFTDPCATAAFTLALFLPPPIEPASAPPHVVSIVNSSLRTCSLSSNIEQKRKFMGKSLSTV